MSTQGMADHTTPTVKGKEDVIQTAIDMVLHLKKLLDEHHEKVQNALRDTYSHTDAEADIQIIQAINTKLQEYLKSNNLSSLILLPDADALTVDAQITANETRLKQLETDTMQMSKCIQVAIGRIS
eukprot:m.72665 g.72665  ORF g.72665 m.72665 type:complete len:126 (-) comp24477_c0_seq1:75-452(-)